MKSFYVTYCRDCQKTVEMKDEKGNVLNKMTKTPMYCCNCGARLY